MDNITQAHDIIHTLKLWKRGGMLIQLDLAKNYDKIRWNYMIKTLEAFGFTQQWISWIVSLVFTTSYSLLINGALAKPFWPMRGIRQGDLMSPFLFILMADSLSRKLIVEKEEGTNLGVRLMKGLEPLNHALFAVDNILLGRASIKIAKVYSGILQKFWTKITCF